MWLLPVGQQNYYNDDEEQPSSSCDTEDSRKGEQAVGSDVNLSWRDVESADLNLNNCTIKLKDLKIFNKIFKTCSKKGKAKK